LSHPNPLEDLVKGSTYKRCKCRDADGKELGAKCPQLRRKNGSWNPRHGTWYYKIELEPGPGGKRRTMTRGGFASETDAQNAAEQARAEDARGADPKNRLKVGPYLRRWIASRKDLRPTTLKSYREHIDLYLEPQLGHIELGKLRVSHLGDMFDAIDAEARAIEEANGRRRALRAELRTLGRTAGGGRPRADSPEAVRRAELLDEIAALPPHRRPPGPATKQRVRATLRAALSDAVRDPTLGISTNVAKLIRMESGRRPRAIVWTAARVDAWTAAFEQAAPEGETDYERFLRWAGHPRPSRVMVWTPAQTGAFLDHAAADRLYALYHLIAFRGLRRGEACGLLDADVDLDGREITIREQRVRLSYSDVQDGAPKTDGSEGTVALDQATAEAMRAYRAARRRERLTLGEAWAGSGKFFVDELGAPLHPDLVYERFMRLAYDAGLPPIRLHDLRHGAATLTLAAGADMKVVQALLRHSSIQITADTYTSVLPEAARAAAEAAAALVPRRAAAGESGTAGLPSVSPGVAGKGRPGPVGVPPQVGRG